MNVYMYVPVCVTKKMIQVHMTKTIQSSLNTIRPTVPPDFKSENPLHDHRTIIALQ